MTTDVTLDIRVRFNALAALECDSCGEAVRRAKERDPSLFYTVPSVSSCPDCGGTGRRYLVLSQPCPCGCHHSPERPMHIRAVAGLPQPPGTWWDGGCCGNEGRALRNRTPLPLHTEADRQRAVGALMEALAAHDEIEVSWHRRQMYIHLDTNGETAECIAKGSNLEALVMALEALEAAHDAP